MSESTSYEGITNIIHISTNIDKPCPFCGEMLKGTEGIDASANHLLKQHGYKLLHVGSEWDRDPQGNSIHHTVAVLGL